MKKKFGREGGALLRLQAINDLSVFAMHLALQRQPHIASVTRPLLRSSGCACRFGRVKHKEAFQHR